MPLKQINFSFDDDSTQKNETKETVNQHTPADKNTLAGIRSEIKPKSKRGRKSLKEYNAEPDVISVPADEVLFQKQYYSIGNVALMFKENTSLIRYWEKEFSILKPKKNKKGDRFFRPEDIKNLKMIYHLLRERKYTIEGAKEFIRNNRAAGEKHEMIESLEKVKLFLLELKNNL
ncbi:MAG TPA: MerR family transcriptional regulator [Hanamia sp.]|nr:MerR family transcriptional regulator [Hanamia sp.]